MAKQKTNKRSRRLAEQTSGAILNNGRMVTDSEVLRVLRQWSFRKNRTRKNVRPDGADHVESDTLGIVATRDGRVCLSKQTRKHTNLFRLLARWLRGNGPNVGRSFPFTSINVNGSGERAQYCTPVYCDSIS